MSLQKKKNILKLNPDNNHAQYNHIQPMQKFES